MTMYIMRNMVFTKVEQITMIANDKFSLGNRVMKN